MASPIFISKPPENFSVVSVIRGCQLALLGLYRLVQNPDFIGKFCISGVYALLISLGIHITHFLARRVVKWLLYLANILLKNDNTLEYIRFLEYFHLIFSLPHVFIITFINLIENHIDANFMMSLKIIENHDKENNYTQDGYYCNLSKLSTGFEDYDHLPFDSYYIRFKFIKSIRHYQDFITRYFSALVLNIFVHLISKVPKIDILVINFINFQCFHDKIGTLPSLFIIAFLNTISRYYNFVALIYFWGSMNLSHDLLLPFFMRIKLTKYERDQWIKSREGILFGFGLFYFYLICTFPSVSMLIYSFAQASTAYLVTKISDTPPSNESALINWNSSQLIWNKKKRNILLSGVL